MRRTLLALALAALPLLACDKDPTKPPAPLPSLRLAWIGTFDAAAGADGDIILDLNQTGTTVQGQIVYGAPAFSALVKGSVSGDSIFLNLDPAYSSNPADLTIRVRATGSGSLTGTMTRASQSLVAVLTCRSLPVRSLTADATFDLPRGVYAMEYDGSRLWLTTTAEYIRMETNGSIADTVEVELRPGYLWISDALAWDGAKMWGFYRISIGLPGGGTWDVSDLLAFDAGGRTGDSLRVDHRPSGLAFDGANLWTLARDRKRLLRLDGTGGIADSLAVGIPDAIHLAHDGSHFWTLGWYLRRAYEIDGAGDVVAMYDLPVASAGGWAGGLAVEGAHIWYVDGGFSGSKILRTTPSP